MARKKKSANQKAYEKELNRIKRFIRNAEKRGFRFSDFELPKPPARYTKKQVEKLKELTSTKLYHKATYLDPETGKVVGGLRGRTIERRTAARKGIERKAKKARRANAADLVMRKINSLIEEYPTRGARYLNKLLNRQIEKYGKEVVAKSIAMAPEDMIQMAQEIVYYRKDSQYVSRALYHFAEIILGSIPTDSEKREMEDVLSDMDEMWDDA